MEASETEKQQQQESPSASPIPKQRAKKQSQPRILARSTPPHSKKTTGVHGNTGKSKKKRAPSEEGLLEEQKRITQVKKMIANMMYKHEIKDVLKQLHGIQWRAADLIITRARKELALEAGKSVEEHKVDSYAFYVAALRDPQLPMQAKVYIRERIDRLFGLESHRIIHQGSKEEPIQVQHTATDPLSLMERARAIVKEAEGQRAAIQRTATVIATGPAVPERSREGIEGTAANDQAEGEAGKEADRP